MWTVRLGGRRSVAKKKIESESGKEEMDYERSGA